MDSERRSLLILVAAAAVLLAAVVLLAAGGEQDEHAAPTVADTPPAVRSSDPGAAPADDQRDDSGSQRRPAPADDSSKVDAASAGRHTVAVERRDTASSSTPTDRVSPKQTMDSDPATRTSAARTWQLKVTAVNGSRLRGRVLVKDGAAVKSRRRVTVNIGSADVRQVVAAQRLPERIPMRNGKPTRRATSSLELQHRPRSALAAGMIVDVTLGSGDDAQTVSIIADGARGTTPTTTSVTPPATQPPKAPRKSAPFAGTITKRR